MLMCYVEGGDMSDYDAEQCVVEECVVEEGAVDDDVAWFVHTSTQTDNLENKVNSMGLIY